MTGGAIFRRRLIENHRLRPDNSRELMTLCTAHVVVRTPQREFRALLVIEERGLPLHAVVTLRAAGYVGFGELLPMYIFMAVLAQCRCLFEVHVEEIGFEVWRLMAVDAGCRSMRSEQGELRLRVIKAGYFLPRFRAMASLASSD